MGAARWFRSTAGRVAGPVSNQQRLLRAERVLTRAGIFDTEWYEAQSGERFADDRSALRHYLRADRRNGYSPHPLFEADWADPRWADGPGDPLVDYLNDDRRRTETSPHPAFDLQRASAQLNARPGRRPRSTPRSADPGAWLAWVWRADAQTPVPLASTAEAPTWGELRAALLGEARAWRRRQGLLDASRPVDRLPVSDQGVAHPVRAAASDDPLVTVVLATWNRSGSLRRAVESVLDQAWSALELVVVDDGSDDDTLAVLAGLQHFDSRLKVVALPRGGVCAARNAGLAVATGRYVAFLDSDNTWAPDFLTAMVSAMEANSWRAAHGALRINSSAGVSYRASDGGRDSLLVGNHIDLNTLVVTRELLVQVGGFDESLRRAVDYDLVLRLSAVVDLPLVKVVGADYREDSTDVTRISNSEPKSWNQVVRGRHLVDWADLATRPRESGLVSVIVPVARNLQAMLSWLDLVRPELSGTRPRVELVLVGMSRRSHPAVLRACSWGLPVAVVSHPVQDQLPLLTNLGIAASRGEHLVLARPNVVMTHAALGPLVAALDETGAAVAQPLVERSDQTVASAGACFAPHSLAPRPLLEGFPTSDALRLGDGELPAAESPVLAARAADLIALRGLDPIFGNTWAEVDLSLRARHEGLGVTRLVVGSRATARAQQRFGFPHDLAQSARLLTERWQTVPPGSEQLWARAGFDVAGYRPIELGGTAYRGQITWGLAPELRRRPAVEVVEGTPSLRWTIDTAAPSGERGAQWGDRHFASSLAGALAGLGQQVAMDHREARSRSTRLHDDVLLVIRGLDEVSPPPGPTSLLWVISHPDLVTPWEAARYDRVFAASTSWSEQKRAQWGLPVTPLLQCTDPALFNTERGTAGSGPPVLFVGNSRNVFRPVLQQALAADVEVAVYGAGWEPFVESHLIRSTHVPHADVGRLYASAGLVLNDHWDDMRRDGFLSNRLFDAVACGARVVSDDITGLGDTFGDSVYGYRSQLDMDAVVRDPDRFFPGLDTRRAHAAQVAAEHSFEVRAQTLLAAVLEQRSRQRDATEPELRDGRSSLRRW